MSNPPTPEHAGGARAIEPGRLVHGEPVGPLWMITLAGIAAWLIVGSTCASVKLALQPPQGTPTTQLSYSPHETVLIGVIIGTAVIVTLVLGNILTRPYGGLANLGISFRVVPRGMLLGLVAAVVILPLVFVSAILTQVLWDYVGLEHPNAHLLLRLLAENQDPALRAMVFVSAVVFAPLYEELLFRAHLQTAILHTMDRTGRRASARATGILITSIVFALFHGELWMMPPIFVLSVCIGYAYEWTSNLWTPIVIHMAFNTVNLVYFITQTNH
jgi:membrane protease YdiL (CAAX protease family)